MAQKLPHVQNIRNINTNMGEEYMAFTDLYLLLGKFGIMTHTVISYRKIYKLEKPRTRYSLK